jgi:hypothetical protein
MARRRRAALLGAGAGLCALGLHGCGGGDSPSPSPPGPTPPSPSPVPVAPLPSEMNFTIADPAHFHCVKEKPPTGEKYRHGFFMYRYTTKSEVEKHEVNSDDFGDLNAFYLLTEMMTTSGGQASASKQGNCKIHPCGEDPAGGGCVLERVYIEMNHEPVTQVLQNNGIWGEYLAVDNGIPSDYTYWAFNWTNCNEPPCNPNKCSETEFTQNCNFYFKGGYPIGCQTKSDLLDNPVWYSTVAGCPQYPFNPSSSDPEKVAPNFTWYGKFENSAQVKKCYEEMQGGNYCDGIDNKTQRPRGHPFTTPSPTCTWSAKSAGYLTIEDIFNIDSSKYKDYTEWCLAQPDNITGYGNSVLGIPSNITFFYNLSELSFPSLQGLTSLEWHIAAGSVTGKLTSEQIGVFQHFAKWARVRLDEMFTEMDKQAFKKFREANITDPDNHTYEGCLTNSDVETPSCNNGVYADKESSVIAI